MDSINLKTPDNKSIKMNGNYDKNDKTIFYADNGKAYKLDSKKNWTEFTPEQKVVLPTTTYDPYKTIEVKQELLPTQMSTQNISPQEADEYNKNGGYIMRGGTDVGNIYSTVKGQVSDYDKAQLKKVTGDLNSPKVVEPDNTLTLPQELINLYLQKSQGVDQPVEFRTYKPVDPAADVFTSIVKGLSEGMAREIQKDVTGEVGKIDALKTISDFEKLTGKKFTKNGVITPSKKGLTYEQMKLLEETKNLIPQRLQLSNEQIEAQKKYYDLMKDQQAKNNKNEQYDFIVNSILSGNSGKQ